MTISAQSMLLVGESGVAKTHYGAQLLKRLVNILNYHITMDPSGIGLGFIATILWVIVLLPYRSSFAPIFQQHSSEKTTTTV
jgi:hypothetical protein